MDKPTKTASNQTLIEKVEAIQRNIPPENGRRDYFDGYAHAIADILSLLKSEGS